MLGPAHGPAYRQPQQGRQAETWSRWLGCRGIERWGYARDRGPSQACVSAENETGGRTASVEVPARFGQSETVSRCAALRPLRLRGQQSSD